MLNYNHLYYFYVTARSGGVTSAAQALRIAQPSLSAQIKTLETSLGKALFRKSGRKLVLTPEGDFVYGYCRKIFEPAEELERSLASGEEHESPRIHLGISDEVDRPFIVEVTGRILRSYPKSDPPRLSTISGSHASMLPQLKNRMIDALITNQPALDDAIVNVSNYPMPIVGVIKTSIAPKPEKITHGNELRAWSRTNRINWILPHRRLRLRTETDSFLEKHRIAANVVFESDMIASLVRAALEGMGLALLPLPYVRSAIRQKRLLAFGLPHGFWKHGVWLYTSRGSENEPVIQALKDTLNRSMRQETGNT